MTWESRITFRVPFALGFLRRSSSDGFSDAAKKCYPPVRLSSILLLGQMSMRYLFESMKT